MKKFILSCLLSALCIMIAYAETDSGTCGESLYWSYDTSTKVLSITGQGDMFDYEFISYFSEYTTPWWKYHKQIEVINIDEGVISIGKYAFTHCDKVSNVNLPNSLKKIGEEGFSQCSALSSSSIGNLPSSLEEIGRSAFSQCTSLTSISVGEQFNTLGDYSFYLCSSLTSFTCASIYPPTVIKHANSGYSTDKESYAFRGANKDLTIYVPCRSLSTYENSDWSRLGVVWYSHDSYDVAKLQGLGNCEEPPVPRTYTVTVLSSDISKGTVSGGGQYEEGTTVTITATPKEGYDFIFWSDESEQNPYSFIVTEDVTITAYFGVDYSSTYVVIVQSADSLMGTASFSNLSGTQNLNYGQYTIGTNLIAKANPNQGYKFSHWNDGISANPRGITVESNIILRAYFESENTTQPMTYTVSVSSANTSMGAVSGGGQYEEGETATVTATPKSGYKFTKWSNGSTVNPYSFTVTSNVSLTAYFEQSSTPEPENSTFWNISDAAFNSLGSITSKKTIDGLTIYATENKPVVIDADAREIDGLSFTHRLKFGGTGASDARTLSFKVDGNCDIDVYLMSASGSADRTLNVDKGSFGNSLATIPALSSSASRETVHYTGGATTVYLYSPSSGVNIYAIRVTSESTPQPTTYTVSVSSANTSMGTVYGGGQYEEGTTATVTATPKSGYKFTKWSNGSTANPYSFAVTNNVSLTAYFEQSSTPQPQSSKFWNISDDTFNSLGTITSTKTVDGLTIYATSSKNVVIDGSNQEIDELSFTHRLKLNGTGSNDARMLSFKVEGKCDIDVYLKSGSGSEDRTLNIDKGSFGSSLTTIPALSASISKGTIHYTGGATTIYLYSSSGGVNIYAIRVTSENTPQPTTYTVSVSSANTSMGTVSGGGTYEEGATATVTASPKSGYKFTKWSNGSTANPYSFTVTSNMSLTAYFEQSSTPEPASSKFWNISDGAFNSLGTISSTKTVDGLTIYATSSKNVVIDGSNQEIDGLSFTHRLKLNGTGSSDARLLSFHVDGKCDIDVYLKSGSGTEDRTLNIDKGSFGSSLTTIPALSASISKGTIHYTGGATTIYLYSPSSGVNVYAIRVTTGGGSEDIENTYYQEERAQKILRNGQILIIRGDHTYTLQGQEVK